MIKNKRVVAVIPARAGSKTITDKNIMPIAGKPLIAWPIESGLKCDYIDRVIVSTDGEKIANVAREHGAEVYLRPEKLAQDDSLVIDCLRDLISRLRTEGEAAEFLVLLEATSPLRADEDIRKCLELIEQNDYDSVATFSDAELNPHRAWKVVSGQVETFIEGAIPWLPRQALPEAIQLNGAVYVFKIDGLPDEQPAILFGKKGAVVIPAERAVDIDNQIHFTIAEALLNKRKIL